MDLESEMSQSEKEKYHIPHLHVDSNEQNKVTNLTETGMDTRNRLTAVRWLGVWGVNERR